MSKHSHHSQYILFFSLSPLLPVSHSLPTPQQLPAPSPPPANLFLFLQHVHSSSRLLPTNSDHSCASGTSRVRTTSKQPVWASFQPVLGFSTTSTSFILLFTFLTSLSLVSHLLFPYLIPPCSN